MMCRPLPPPEPPPPVPLPPEQVLVLSLRLQLTFANAVPLVVTIAASPADRINAIAIVNMKTLLIDSVAKKLHYINLT